MTTVRECDELATQEQLDLLHQLGVRLRINVDISRVTARASIEFLQATPRHVDYLRRLGYEIDRPITKRQASEMIEKRRSTEEWHPRT